jgi:hypothetical protein
MWCLFKLRVARSRARSFTLQKEKEETATKEEKAPKGGKAALYARRVSRPGNDSELDMSSALVGTTSHIERAVSNQEILEKLKLVFDIAMAAN